MIENLEKNVVKYKSYCSFFRRNISKTNEKTIIYPVPFSKGVDNVYFYSVIYSNVYVQYSLYHYLWVYFLLSNYI